MIEYSNRNGRTTNLLKAIHFDYPDWVPTHVDLLPATWMKYRESLESVVLDHPKLFPFYKKGMRAFDRVDNLLHELGEHTDCWGVVWKNTTRGFDSWPVRHPLEDWSVLDEYKVPDPSSDDMFGRRDWMALSGSFDRAKRNGDLATADVLPHGFLFMTAAALRGFGNLMSDFAAREPRLCRLFKIVEHYAGVVIEESVRLGAEYVRLGDDFGGQHSLMISPELWRKFLKPSYKRILEHCRQKGSVIRFHSDGHVVEIIPDLIEIGIRVLNLQYTANGLDGLQRVAQGRVALEIDLDRQLFPFALRSEIEDHVSDVFHGLNMPQGGLLLYAACGPDVPLETIDALCSVLEKVCRLPEPCRHAMRHKTGSKHNAATRCGI